jgi:hypothetical protein
VRYVVWRRPDETRLYSILLMAVEARNIFGWVGRHFNVIITFFIMFVVIAGKEFLC